ncbi:MAG: hypothetical protein MZV63_62160 [Marinilabiliales bacterium]|nr:hypothetical protein [Marinilabiliales bacterium]
MCPRAGDCATTTTSTMRHGLCSVPWPAYENVNPEPTGIIAGTVKRQPPSPEYYFKPGTKDEAILMNSAVVTLNPGGISVTLDNLNNGSSRV